MSAQYRTPSPEEIRREFLEALRMELREASIAFIRAEKAVTELTVLEGFGSDLREETRQWAEGGIRALISPEAARALQLEVVG